ncbi:MAG: iron-containing alcohol dehydrogenase, partial [Chitinophagales bacterium]
MEFNTVYQYNFPTTIRFGAGASNELGDYLVKNNLSSPLIVTDRTVAQLDFFKEIINDLKKKNISTEIFSDIHKNPVKSDVYKGTDVYDTTGRDSIIGIGGGAALDVARAIVLRVNHREDLFKYDDL